MSKTGFINLKNASKTNARKNKKLIHIPERDLGPEELFCKWTYYQNCRQLEITKKLSRQLTYFWNTHLVIKSNSTAVNTAKVIKDIMTRHAYLHTHNITDKRSIFVSHVIPEVSEILGVQCTTTKHTHTIGVPERTYATIKTSLGMASGEYRKQWHKSLPILILNYTTTYNSGKDCETSRVFRGSVQHNILDHKLGLRFIPKIATTTEFADELLRRTKILFDKTKKIAMQSDIKYKKRYKKSESPAFRGERILPHSFNQKQIFEGNKNLFVTFVGLDQLW